MSGALLLAAAAVVQASAVPLDSGWELTARLDPGGGARLVPP